MGNGFKFGEKVVDFMREKPKSAAFFLLLVMAATNFGTSFLGHGASIKKEIALLQAKQGYILSEITAVRKAHAEEMVRLKEDGKHETLSDIQLLIKAELEKFQAKRFNRIR